MEKDFRDECHELCISTDDGSWGVAGFVTSLLEKKQRRKSTVYLSADRYP